jgi:dTDP-4-dehydrorhamnose reductase
MKLLITGAAGMLGQDVVTAATASGHDVLGFSRADLDITDPAAVQSAVVGARADVVLNCAAWTDVDGAEAASDEASAVNGAGAGNVARAAMDSGAWLIQVSSDYVFSGAKREPYLESDPTEPLSAYGRSKLGPSLCRHTGDRSWAARSRSHTRRRDATRSSGLPGCSGPAARASRRQFCGSLRNGTS